MAHLLIREGCPESWQWEANEQKVGVGGDVVVQTGECHLCHVHRLRADVQHARSEYPVQEDLSQHLCVFHRLLNRIVLLRDAKVVTMDAPQVKEVAQLLLIGSKAIMGVEEQELADEGTLHHRHIHLREEDRVVDILIERWIHLHFLS